MDKTIQQKIKDLYFFSKYSIWDRKSYRYYRTLERNQWLSSDELHHINWVKRKNLIRDAYHHVRFYKKFYDEAGLHPEDLKKPEDFSRIPILTRDHIRDHFDELVADNIKRKHLKNATTGGTTGKPVRTYIDRRVSHAALGWRMLNWWGLSPSMDIAISWRKLEEKGLRKFLDKFIWWPTRQLFCNASLMTMNNLNNFFIQFNRLRPPILHGYVGAIHHLAHYVNQTGIEVVPPKAVWVTCAPLSNTHRQFIERIFQAPVYDQYASCEIYWISSQCEAKDKHHIFYDARHVEFLDDRMNPLPDGEVGHLIVTDLENRAFPLIRYRIGDRGRALSGRCSCGRTLPIMDAVMGKSVDLIKFPDGTCISDMNIIFDDCPEVVSGFQIHQKKDFSIELKYIPDKDPEVLDPILKKIRQKYFSVIESKVPVRFTPVNHIPHKAGKLQYIISEVDQDRMYP